MRRLQLALEQLRTMQGFQDQMGIPAMVAMNTMLSNVKRGQPVGEPEHAFTVGNASFGGRTVSERRGHVPISEGWKPTIEFTENGLSMKLSNISQHVGPIVHGYQGSGEYIITPRSPGKNLVFWWGAPQRWPAKDGAPDGARVFKFVTHPGPTPDPFVAEAKKQSTEPMKEAISSGISSYIRRMLLDSGVVKEI